jgi:hypothetical protein
MRFDVEVLNVTKKSVDDQICQVWKNRTIRFPILDYPILVDSEKDQGRS